MKVDFSNPLPIALAERLLVAKNPDLVVARLTVKAAAADKAQAEHRPNPNLTFSGTYYRGPYSYAPFPNYSFGGALDTVYGVNQLIERGGKRELRIEATEKEILAAQADLKDTLRKLRFLLAQRYYALAAAEEAVQIANANVESYKKSVAGMQLRFDAGDIPRADLGKMKVEAEQASILLRKAISVRLQAQKDLALLLGEEAHSDEVRTNVTWDLSQLVSSEMPTKPDLSAIIDARPDVVAAEARLDQAHSSKKLAQALSASDVTLGIQYEHLPVGGSISSHNVGVNLSFPLQILYQNQGEIAQAEVAREQAVAQIGRTRAAALQELQKSWTDLGTSSAQIRSYQGEIIPQAELSAKAAEFAYEHGAGSLLELLDARRTFYNIKLDGVNARADYFVAQWQWQSAINKQPDPLLLSPKY